MFRLPLSLIVIFSFFLVTSGFPEALASDVPPGCQPLFPSFSAPAPGPCGPAQPNSSTNARKHEPSFSRPVKVGSCEPRLVPLTYREEGPVRSMVINAVGLLKATIQLPFKAIEAVLPVNRSKPCAPVCGRPQPPCCGNPMPPKFCPSAPIPACGVGPVACAPQGPVVGPLPRQTTTPGCGPQLPPQLVQEHRFPPVEPNNLLQGILNLPGTIVQSGRWFGDMFSESRDKPSQYGQVTP
jgi:hypothetical protein